MEIRKRIVLGIFVFCVVVSVSAQQSVRYIDWMNFSYPLPADDGVPGEVHWMSRVDATGTASLAKGRYVVPDGGEDSEEPRPLITFDSVNYGKLTGIKSRVAVVVLTYHTGGTATWQYVYFFAFESSKPRLLAWLRTGSRAYQGLRDVWTSDGDLFLAVNDPDRRQGDCCSAGTITTRYRWLRESFLAVGEPVYKNDPPSFDCRKASTPIEQMICKDVELSFLDRQMARSYQDVLKGASAARKETIRRQQAEWFADYRRACNAPLSDAQRRDCIDQHLNDRLVTIWK